MRNNLREAVEIKCPLPHTQIQYICEQGPDKYKPQVQGQIMIGDFSAVHFWSWHPDLPPVHIITFPDQAYIKKLRDLLDLFCAEVDAAERFVRNVMTQGVLSAAVGGDGLDEILQTMARTDSPLPSWR